MSTALRSFSQPGSKTTMTMKARKKILKLLTSDNEVFEVEESLAFQARTIKLMVEDGYSDGLIPLPSVRSSGSRSIQTKLS